MRYNTIEDHDEIFVIPEVTTDDKRLFVGMTALGVREDRVRWAYTFATGPFDADIELQGDDLGGPATGNDDRDAGKAVAALLGFYRSYADGELHYDSHGAHLVSQGETVAAGDTARFIKDNGERFSLTETELENGYLEWTEVSAVNYGYRYPLYVRFAVSTGKEEE